MSDYMQMGKEVSDVQHRIAPRQIIKVKKYQSAIIPEQELLIMQVTMEQGLVAWEGHKGHKILYSGFKWPDPFFRQPGKQVRDRINFVLGASHGASV